MAHRDETGGKDDSVALLATRPPLNGGQQLATGRGPALRSIPHEHRTEEGGGATTTGMPPTSTTESAARGPRRPRPASRKVQIGPSCRQIQPQPATRATCMPTSVMPVMRPPRRCSLQAPARRHAVTPVTSATSRSGRLDPHRRPRTRRQDSPAATAYEASPGIMPSGGGEGEEKGGGGLRRRLR